MFFDFVKERQKYIYFFGKTIQYFKISLDNQIVLLYNIITSRTNISIVGFKMKRKLILKATSLAMALVAGITCSSSASAFSLTGHRLKDCKAYYYFESGIDAKTIPTFVTACENWRYRTNLYEMERLGNTEPQADDIRGISYLFNSGILGINLDENVNTDDLT